MNLFVWVLMLMEAAVALGGLGYTVYCVVSGVHIVGVLIGVFTFVIFSLFTGGMWVQNFKKH